jgi:large subunit ribosomal protein L30
MTTSPAPVRSLVVTLRRGLAGVRESQRGVVASLGLRRVGATRRLPNTPSVRGAVDAVRHLLTVKTDEAAAAEAAAARARAAPRPPLEFRH